MNYAIFRSEPIYTLNDLAQIGSHNKREKKVYNSNPDIKLELTKNNIELVPLDSKYVKGFHEITKEYKLEHDERMKTEREDRKRTYSQMLDRSKNVVADEMIFTASPGFFKGLKNKDIKKWADTCMEFVYQDLGYKKEQVLHATLHMDEKTPHIHCVVIPLVKKLDKRTNTERYTISKKQYIRDNKHLSDLQDKYCQRLNDKGFDLERGIKNSDREHIRIKELKKITNSLNKDLGNKHSRLEYELNEFNESLKDKKNILFDKDYVKVKKETFDSMNRVIKEVDDLMDVQDRVEVVLGEVKDQVDSYNTLERKNKNLTNEVKYLKQRNDELEEENKGLKDYIYEIVEKLIEFFRKLLIRGNEETKDIVTDKVKDIYDENLFNNKDVYKTSVGTERQDELFEYANVPSYMKQPIKSNYRDEIDKDDDFDIGF